MARFNIPPVWWIPLVVAVLSTVMQAMGWDTLLRYSREGLQQGEWWLLITGNLVHLGWNHLILNLAGLVMVWWFYDDEFSLLEWLWIFVISGLFVTVGLYFLDPQLIWYVGLSGLLHGLFIAGGIRLLGRDTRFAVLLLLLFAAKLTWEQLFGSLPGTTDMAGGPVVVNAHLYGAIGGAVAALLLLARERLAMALHTSS
jgi:rhomboid family GlyGly-CTERM serine protease